MKYLLDTNVWISALRGSNASVIGKLGSLAADDLWIAAQARANNLILVTANEREFARVPGLRVENWEV